jgi:hypothetical protein
MKAAVLVAGLAGALGSPLPLTPPPDLHIVFRSEFVYQASTRTPSNEWWVSNGKSLARQGDRLSIYCGWAIVCPAGGRRASTPLLLALVYARLGLVGQRRPRIHQ